MRNHLVTAITFDHTWGLALILRPRSSLALEQGTLNFRLMNIHTAGMLTVHYTLVRFTHVDRLFMRFTDVGQQDKVRPSLSNEVEADKLFPVFEVFRFHSQVGFL